MKWGALVLFLSMIPISMAVYSDCSIYGNCKPATTSITFNNNTFGANVSGAYVPYSGAIGDVDLNGKSLTLGTAGGAGSLFANGDVWMGANFFYDSGANVFSTGGNPMDIGELRVGTIRQTSASAGFVTINDALWDYASDINIASGYNFYVDGGMVAGFPTAQGYDFTSDRWRMNVINTDSIEARTHGYTVFDFFTDAGRIILGNNLDLLNIYNIRNVNRTETKLLLAENVTSGDILLNGTGRGGRTFRAYYDAPNTAYFISTSTAELYYKLGGIDAFYMTQTGFNFFNDKGMKFGTFAYGFNGIHDQANTTSDQFVISVKDRFYTTTGVPARSLILADFDDRYVDWGKNATNPTFWIQSNQENVSNYIAFRHNTTTAMILSGSNRTAVIGDYEVTGNLKIDGNISVKKPYFIGYDNSTQNFQNTANVQVINITNNAKYDAWMINVTDRQNLTFKEAGDYQCTLSPEFFQNGGGSLVTFWMQLNGTDVPWSNSRYSMSNNEYHAPSIIFHFDINNPATENVRFMWYSDSIATQIYSSGPLTLPTRPSVPGVLVTCLKVSEVTPQ